MLKDQKEYFQSPETSVHQIKYTYKKTKKVNTKIKESKKSPQDNEYKESKATNKTKGASESHY